METLPSWTSRRSYSVLILTAVLCVSNSASPCQNSSTTSDTSSDLDRALKRYVDRVLDVDEFSIIPGVDIEKTVKSNQTANNGAIRNESCATSRSLDSLQDYVERRLQQYSENHVLSVNFPETARFFFPAAEVGKSSFLTGFGMGFLAFFLKKLLLPVFIGAQLVKSVLIAMFLPSILGSVGKLLGKGLSTFSGISGASAGINNNNNVQQVEDFEFKDVDPYSNDVNNDANPDSDTLSLNVASSTSMPITNANSRFGIGNNKRVSFVSQHQLNDNYYMRKPSKKTDYKVFHKIPSSSMLLTTYDPFYSPLLSRLDAVFQQLGLGNEKSPETERCRERLVCMMYANPAKYAPYSNLVSAQLSRELNELRKPSSDNPDILRFFRYMKAAKDGQDGEECLQHGGCPALSTNQASPAILTTYNEINKLVQARKFQ